MKSDYNFLPIIFHNEYLFVSTRILYLIYGYCLTKYLNYLVYGGGVRIFMQCKHRSWNYSLEIKKQSYFFILGSCWIQLWSFMKVAALLGSRLKAVILSLLI